MCCGCYTSYIVSVHIQFQASIYTLSLCRGHSWQVRLAKQETLTPPGHLVSPLVCRGPWMSTVVLYCWCHSDSASVLLYFTFCLQESVYPGPYTGRRCLNWQKTEDSQWSLYKLVSIVCHILSSAYRRVYIWGPTLEGTVWAGRGYRL